METITACENVCRDFSWMSPFLTWLAQIAPAIAIIWAVYAYYQKRTDDREDVLRALRADFYHSTFESLTRYSVYLQSKKVREFMDREYGGEIHEDFNRSINEILLLGTQEHVNALKDFVNVTGTEDNIQKRVDCLEKLRLDLRDSFRRDLGLSKLDRGAFISRWQKNGG